MLPQVTASIVDNNSVQNLSQTRVDGTEVERDNAKNSNLSYGVALEWTIFDGLRMFANYEQLKETEKLGEAELKQAILGKVGDVMTTYYDLVQQQQQLGLAIRDGGRSPRLGTNPICIAMPSNLEAPLFIAPPKVVKRVGRRGGFIHDE